MPDCGRGSPSAGSCSTTWRQGRSLPYGAAVSFWALVEMVKDDLVAERVAVESYRQMIDLIGDKDPTTRRMLEEILHDEEEHADELKDMLDE